MRLFQNSVGFIASGRIAPTPTIAIARSCAFMFVPLSLQKFQLREFHPLLWGALKFRSISLFISNEKARLTRPHGGEGAFARQLLAMQADDHRNDDPQARRKDDLP